MIRNGSINNISFTMGARGQMKTVKTKEIWCRGHSQTTAEIWS